MTARIVVLALACALATSGITFAAKDKAEEQAEGDSLAVELTAMGTKYFKDNDLN